MARRTWLITGCSSGFGSVLVDEVLKRGDIAIATARGDISRLQHFKERGAHTYSLDITASYADIKSTVSQIIEDVGQIDVLMNNAGYMQAGLFEELGDEGWQIQFDTNLFGTIKLTRALLAHFRKRRAGIIAFNSSMLGWQGFPGAPAYCASKFGIEAIHDSLTAEVASFGIKVITFEPGMFRTEVMDQGKVNWGASTGISDFDDTRMQVQAAVQDSHQKQLGDTAKGVEVMVDVIRGEGVAENREVPTRLPLGSDAFDMVKAKCEGMATILKECEEVIRSTDFPHGGYQLPV